MKMKYLLLSLSLLFINPLSAQKTVKKSASLRKAYIPRDLAECFQQIDAIWSDSIKNEIKELTENEFAAKTHFGFGRWIRNNWGLWGGSRLKKYFNEMGIYHPDDMSGIILDSYHRYLSGKEILLEEQLKYYQAYWEKAEAEAPKKKRRFKRKKD